MNTPFTAEERSQFLARYYVDLERFEELDYKIATSDNDVPEMMTSELEELQTRLSEARDQYRMNVPVLPLSRCPYTKQVVYHSVDPYGFDGLWWDSDAPIRPVEVLPPTFFMINGAVTLGVKLEKTVFPVKPGPEVPYVVPEVLSQPGIKAAVSSLKVGGHTAYPIFYFIEDWADAVEPMNSWGANYWSYLNADQQYSYHEYGAYPEETDPEYDEEEHDDAEDEPEEYTIDFDLEKWFEQGKLLWIAPDDPSLTLREGTTGCPYLNLAGSRSFNVIYDGELVEETEEEE
ncbi:hypothetical protein JXL21_14855 [Candidatus Bathyarchaeota archaeon]|nr:hypothetical protein [Candidatus Bathyarchaeota archaeon]